MRSVHQQEYVCMGQKIQARRKDMGLTQEKLAEKLGCSITHLSRIESGSKPGLDALLRLSRVLGCSLDMLLGVCPPEDPVLQDIINLLQTRSSYEQYLALQHLENFFQLIDQL